MRRYLILLAVAGLAFAAPMAGVQPTYSFFEVAGSTERGTRDGQGPEAQFTSPFGVARDSAGNLYVADTGAYTVRKITPAGLVSTLAGIPGQQGVVNGTGSAARFMGPRSVAVDTSNNIYVTDWGEVSGVDTYFVRKITPSGVVTTIGTAPVSSFRGNQLAIAVDDRDGAVFVANGGYHIIERFTQAGSYSVFAGVSGSADSTDGSGAAARFNGPGGIAIDATGLVYVADTNNHTIRRITPEGLVSTWLGTVGDIGPSITVSGFITYQPGVDGAPGTSRFNRPEALSLDRATGRILSVGSTTSRPQGNLTTITIRDRLRAIAADGTVTTIFGDVPGLHQIHTGVWAGSVAMVTSPDEDMAMVFSSTTGGVLTEFAGRGSGCTAFHSIDGSRNAARFCSISSLDVDPSGGMYVTDSRNFNVRYVAPGGAVTTVAGSAMQSGSANGEGDAARFGQNTGYPGSMGIKWSPYATFVADTANSTIRSIQGNMVGNVAGSSGQTGSNGGRGAVARFNLPYDLTVNSAATLLISDTANHTIRTMTNPFSLSPPPLVGDLAGQGTPGSADGTGTAAQFFGPQGIDIGPGDVAYVADTQNHTVRRIASGGVVTTLAGLAGQAGTVDGNGTSARFNLPTSVAVDVDGNVFVGQLAALRRITPSGDVTTIPGTPGTVQDVDAAGTLYLSSGGRIFVGTTAGSTPATPVITTAPANTTVTAGSTTPGSMSAAASGVPAPTYRWEVSTNGGTTWTNVSDGSGITGSATSTLTFTAMPITAHGYRYRAVASNAFGSATSAPAVLTVAGAIASPASLRIGVQRGGAHLSTQAQRVVASYTGSGTPTWTASDDAPWLSVDGSSTDGAQTGVFLVYLASNAIDFNTAPDTMTATVTFTASNGATVQVPVTLRIVPGGPTPVIGQVDTPAQNAAGVQGAIGVTGWAVHPIGVNRVRVFRDCFAGENCTQAPEANLNRPIVYIGDALFIAGARPDIEAAFPDYPASDVGGWGMQILTNQLPRTTGTFSPTGGQGPITLYVVATPRPATLANSTGDVRQLSRSWTDTVPVPTTITLDNDTIAKPFGTTDTPYASQIVSGVVANFGWVLTPDSDTVAGPGDILIPTNGSTVTVFIDGVATAQVAYNQCRGTVGNPVPAGAYCNDDVASLFGNATPQPALGTRTSNPTRFRNLDSGRGAIGAYNIDTTLLSNGLHTLAWSVTDSEGRVEGIGSRYFTVLNGSSDAISAEFGVLSAQRAGATADRRDSGVLGRTGFDLRRPWTPLHADPDGVRHVRIPVTNGRVELSLGAGIEAGYLEANGERRALPAGAAFDTATGIFTWAPGPGYIGTYRFVFGGVTVDITLNTPAPTPAGESEVRMHLDAARLRQGYGAATTLIDVVGWAFDPQAEIGSGIATVHVWASRVQSPGSWVPGGASPIFLGEATLDVARPDVAAAFGAPFGHAGFRLESTAVLPAGEYDITAYVWNWRTARWEDARSARVVVR